MKESGKRPCVFTGKTAHLKGKLIPSKLMSEDDSELHNWANKVPVFQGYQDVKRDQLPTELEMEANEAFYKLELAKLRVKFYELKLAKIQELISKENPESETTTFPKTKIKEIKKAYHIADLDKAMSEAIKEEIETRKNIDDFDTLE